MVVSAMLHFYANTSSNVSHISHAQERSQIRKPQQAPERDRAQHENRSERRPGRQEQGRRIRCRWSGRWLWYWSSDGDRKDCSGTPLLQDSSFKWYFCHTLAITTKHLFLMSRLLMILLNMMNWINTTCKKTLGENAQGLYNTRRRFVLLGG